MAVGKIALQADDTRIYEITAEDGAVGNVALTLPKEGGMLTVDAEVVHKTGDETIAGIKTLTDITRFGVSPKQIRVSYSSANNYGEIHSADWGTEEADLKIAGKNLIFSSGIYSNIERLRIDTSGNVLVTGSCGLGYGTGSGGTVTQLTSKSTAVTLNKPCGQITMAPGSLVANTGTQFSLVNSLITTTDSVILSIKSGVGAYNRYDVSVESVLEGSCIITLRNITATSQDNQPIINFAIIKGATA